MAGQSAIHLAAQHSHECLEAILCGPLRLNRLLNNCISGVCLRIPKVVCIQDRRAALSGEAYRHQQLRLCDFFNETPLHLAAANATSECANLLLEVPP